MPPKAPFAWQGYLIAVVGTAVMGGMRYALSGMLGETAPTIPFVLPVVLAAWSSGFWPGILATGMGALVSTYLFVPQHFTLWIESPAEVVALSIFLLCGVAISVLCESLHAARRRLDVQQVRLRASEEFHRILGELTADYGWSARVEPGSKVVTEGITDGFTRLLGYTLAELQQSGWELVCHPDERERAQHVVARLLHGETVKGEMRHVAKDGRVVWISYLTRPIRGENGSVVRLVGAAQDITGRKKADEQRAHLEHELQRRLDELQTLLDLLPVGVWQADKDCERIIGNAAAYQMLGLPQGCNASLTATQDRLVGVRCMVDGRELAVDELPLQLAARTGKPVRNFEHDVVFADGTVKTMFCNVAPLLDGTGQVRGVVGMYADISERKRFERELQASEARFRDFMDNSPARAWLKDAQGRYVFVNRSILTAFGLSAEDMMGKTDADLFSASLAEQYRRNDLAVLSGGIPIEVMETSVEADGEHHILSIKFPVHDPQGGWYVGGVGVDITQQKRAESEARRLAALIEGTPDFVAIARLDGQIVYMNQAGRRLVGITPDADLATVSHASLCPAWVVARTQQEWLPAALRDGSASGEGALYALDGREIPVSFVLLIHRTSFGEPEFISTLARDISDRKQAEQELVRERELLQTIINRIPVMITLYEPDTRLVRLNPEFERIIGWSSAEAAGVSLMEQCYPDPEYRQWVAQFMQSGRDGWMDIRMRTRDGHDVETSWANVRLSDRTQVGIGIDISERKRAEATLRESEARFRRTFDCNMVPMGVWTREGSIIEANEALLDLIGYTREELHAGRVRWIDLTPPEHLHLDKEWLRQIEERGVSLPYEKEYLHKDGQRIPILIGGAAFDDTADGGVFFAIDLSRQKKAEEELRRLNSELRDAARRKDDFLATLAHELRNPLAPIRNAAKILNTRGPLDPELQWARDVIDRQVTHMARLLEDLLDVSRITRNKLALRKERVELSAVVTAAIETSRPLIETSRHELTIILPRAPIWLEADPVRLAQVFANLLNNAAKYTEDGGHIHLGAELVGDGVVVSVRDTGIGIAADVLPRIFEIFSQAKPALERAQGGLGIGLSLVKGLVELHGGTVEAHSAGVGQGSEFVVRLPVAVGFPMRQEDAGGNGERGSVARQRILIVDDLTDSADSLAMMLRILGHEAWTAYDGEQAIELAGMHRPDMVLLDIGMPRVNGYEACRRIRQQDWGRGMILIALTGWGQEEDRRRTQEAGFDHHLVKPVDPAALESLLRTLTLR